MTTRSDLKKRVRDRQAKTGESYTTARAHIIGALKPAPEADTKPEHVTAVVLKCNEKSVRLRIRGENGTVTLRCGTYDAMRLKPAQLIEVTLNKRWSWRDEAYASGVIHRIWFDATALDLVPLPLCDRGIWELNEIYEPFQPDSPYYELWAKAASEPRAAFEFDGIAWGAGVDPNDSNACPVSDAAEMVDGGEARELLMDTLLADLRCIDAHVHLGHHLFDDWPEDAIGHYEIALAIGELSLGPDFSGILPWGCMYNRPFLRAMQRRCGGDDDQRSGVKSSGSWSSAYRSSSLTNVNGIESLTTVGGNLTIHYKDALTNLDGLSGLTTVGDYLSISTNAALTNLDGLSGLITVGGTLTILYDGALTNLDGLSGLTIVIGNLTIQYKAVLCQTVVDGFIAGLPVGGDVLRTPNDPGC